MIHTVGLVLAAQHRVRGFVHGLRDGFLFIPRAIGKLFGHHHLLYHHHAGVFYTLGFILSLGLIVYVIYWFITSRRR